MPALSNTLFVGAILFALGALGFLARRNLILMMLSAEMMLHGVSLNLVAFARFHGHYQGQAFTAFVLTVAACEAGLSLAIILALFQRRKTLDVTVWTDLGEAPPEPADKETPAPAAVPDAEEFPKLIPAGRIPEVRLDATNSRKADSRQQEPAGKV